MIGPTHLLHPSQTPHFETFQLFLIYCPNRPRFSTMTVTYLSERKYRTKRLVLAEQLLPLRGLAIIQCFIKWESRRNTTYVMRSECSSPRSQQPAIGLYYGLDAVRVVLTTSFLSPISLCACWHVHLSFNTPLQATRTNVPTVLQSKSSMRNFIKRTSRCHKAGYSQSFNSAQNVQLFPSTWNTVFCRNSFSSGGNKTREHINTRTDKISHFLSSSDTKHLEIFLFRTR